MASKQVRYFGGVAPDYSMPRTEPVEVLCLGLCRTGTTSMIEVMQILGYGTLYNTRELWRRNHDTLLSAAADAKFLGKGKPFTLEQFESAWGEYRCISGEPAVMFAEELVSLYPNAKVVLTVRDDENSWFRSVLETMWLNYVNKFQFILDYVHHTFRKVRSFRYRYWRYMFWNDFPTHGLRVYREHNAMIKRIVPDERLLVFNVKEGWAPLCQFLDKSIPQVEFPHKFRAPDHRALFAAARRDAYLELASKVLKITVPLGVMAAVVWKRDIVASQVRELASQVNW